METPEIKTVDALYPYEDTQNGMIKIAIVRNHRYVEFLVSEDFIEDATAFGSWMKSGVLPMLRKKDQ
jgi:hypothetical protein